MCMSSALQGQGKEMLEMLNQTLEHGLCRLYLRRPRVCSHSARMTDCGPSLPAGSEHSGIFIGKEHGDTPSVAKPCRSGRSRILLPSPPPSLTFPHEFLQCRVVSLFLNSESSPVF